MEGGAITVGIPAYNHERFIDETLEAVAAQTYPNLELVVIDDGSSDGTYSRIEAFLEHCRDRFDWIHAETRRNQGLVPTLNKIFEVSRTDWVFLCSSDDVMYPHRVSAQLQAIQEWCEPELAMVWSAVDWIDETSELLPAPSVRYPAHGVYTNAYLDLLLVNTVYGGTTLRRAAVVESGGFEDGLPFEDWNMWLKLSVHYPLGFVDNTVAKYRRHDGNASSAANSPQIFYGILLTVGDFIAEYDDLVPDEIQRKSLRKNLLRTLRWARRNRPAVLPMILQKLAVAKLRSPRADDFFDLAELIEESFRGETAQRYSGLARKRRRK